MTSPVVTLTQAIERIEWAISVQLERPSNYDRRVTLNADDVLKVIEVARAVLGEKN